MPESKATGGSGDFRITRLLDPHQEVVSFAGRESELDRLIAWCEGQSPGPLRLVSGDEGTGKTRLAVELAWRLAALGWTSEWVGRNVSPRQAAADGKLLLIIDEADMRVGLAELIADHRANAPGSKILLLARTTTAWYNQLEQCEPGVEGLDPDRMTSVIELPRWLGVPGARLLATAAADFGAALGLTGQTAEISDLGAWAENAVIGDLQAWALVEVLRAEGVKFPEQSGRCPALASLFHVELRHWLDSASRAGISGEESQLRQALAAGCLLGAVSREAAEELARRIPGLPASPALADWLHDVLPPGDCDKGWIGLARPERFADSLVRAELAASPDFTSRFLTGLTPDQALRAIPLITRSTVPEATLALLVTQLEALRGPAPVLKAVLNALPWQSPAWANAAVALAKRITAELEPGADPAGRAYWLTNLGVHYLTAERYTDAVEVTAKAIAIRRELAAAEPEAYRDRLAHSLESLALQYGALGRDVEAARADAEAAGIYRDLVSAGADRFLARLGSSLYNAGVFYSRAGLTEQAIPSSEESVAVRRRLAATEPSHRPYLARALSDLGLDYGTLRRDEEAERAIAESVAVYRELAATSPERHRAELAQQIYNLAVMLSQLDRWDEALTTANEAAAIRRDLAGTDLPAYGKDLLTSLDNLKLRHSDLNRGEQALSLAEEALGVRRKLAGIDRAGMLPDLARTLTDLSSRYRKARRGADAFAVQQEAVEAYRELEKLDSAGYLPDLAKSLSSLAGQAFTLRRGQDALQAAEEATTIQRQLADADPAAHQAELTRSLRNLASILRAQGRSREARATAREAAALGG